MGMSLNSDLYIHESDKAALAALKAIPGFSQFVKAFMGVWNEKNFKILNMSSNLRLSEKQMAKYYNMLPPICEKLGIPVPELYVKLDVNPNAYTYGDTNPFIVITSGLLETIPDELIPTVLAHECGHIACHHTLYRTMGSILLNGSASFLSGTFANLALTSIQLAFAYWMRCSEYSADRVAAVCDRTSDKVVELCMRFAGYGKDIDADVDMDLFLEQAEAYKELVSGNALNKTMEFLLFNANDHPLNAIRAYESREWGKSERFTSIIDFMDHPSIENDVYESICEEETEEKHSGGIRIPEGSRYYVGKNIITVLSELEGLGFSNIIMNKSTMPKFALLGKENTVTRISIDGHNQFAKDMWFRLDAEVVINYVAS